MRTSTEKLGNTLRGGSFRAELSVDVFYGSERTMQDLPVDDWSFTWDLDAEIPSTGSMHVTYQDAYAVSVVPHTAVDRLAPFGQVVVPYITISGSSSFRERLRLGTYRIVDPSGRDQFITRRGRRLVTGSEVDLELEDLFGPLKRARFRSIEQPVSTASCWAEIARITRLPVTRTVADKVIPGAITYDRNRVTATQQLAGYLGGIAVPLDDGTVGIVPDAIGAPVAELNVGENIGVVLDVGHTLSASEIANVVYGDFETVDGTPIHVEAEVTSGPLAVSGPYGENVVEFPAERKGGIVTRVDAQAAVNAYRDLLSRGTAPDVPVRTLLDPRLQIGDVITLPRPDRILTGRIRRQTMSGRSGKADAMQLKVEVTTDAPRL